MPSLVLRKSLIKPNGPFIAEPESVRRATQLEADAGVFLPEMVARNCALEQYTPVNVPDFDVEDEIIAYCSPDSTYAVAKRLFDEASKSIIIGIYDFSADYMKELVLNAVQRGVKVKLMLDIDSKEEQALFDELTTPASMGFRRRHAPATRSGFSARRTRRSSSSTANGASCRVAITAKTAFR